MSPPNPRKGRGTHLRLPLAPALGPTSPSLHKAGPEAGARPAGRPPGRDWTQARRPAAPAALPRRVSSSRTGRTRPPAGLRRPGKPGSPPFQATVPRGGQAHPRRPASHARGGGLQRAAPRPSGRRRPAGRGGDSISRTRPFAPNRGTNSGVKSIPLISKGPRPPAPALGGQTMRGRAGGAGRPGNGGGFGAAGPRGPGRPAPGLPSGAHTHTVRPGAGRWPFLLSG